MTMRKILVSLCLIILMLTLLPAWGTRAATLTVTTASDVLDAAANCTSITLASLPGPDGVTSLREAMCAANNSTGPDTIQFAIPGCGSGCTIQPAIALPVMTDDETTIDGYTQEGASPATATTPATLMVELDGSSIANNNGFNIASGGNAIRGLVINRFSLNGVAIGGSEAINNVISGNYIGTDPSGISGLGNGLNGVFIGLDAHSNNVGGDEPADRNVISGNDWSGVSLHGSETMSNTISGNYIGTDSDGLNECANEMHGIYIYGGSRYNTIGGDTPGDRNVISGNNLTGILIYGDGTSGNQVNGNYIGVDATGLTALMNRADGVSIEEGAHENLIGVYGEGDGNVISGNSYNGVLISGANTAANHVSGNFIGVDASGLSALPNHASGVAIWSDGRENLIGGDSVEELNVISGNTDFGINISNGHNNEIIGNIIGLDANGLTAIPNGVDGVALRNGSQNNTIGGDVLGEESNLISGNNHGVLIEDSGTTGNRIRGNVIGVASDLSPLGNTMDGVHLSMDAQDNIIGPNNYISNNGDDGVGVDTPTAIGNTITRNFITANDGLGIHLTNGAHNGITAPTILSAPNGGGTITGIACPDCIVEVFLNEDDEGEGFGFWGSTTANGGGNFSLEVPFLVYPYLTATATDPDDGTSEFSSVFTALIPVLHGNSYKVVDKESASPGELLTYIITLSNSGTAAATATLTDTLSTKVSWIDDASASTGVITWDEDNNRLLWSGTVELDTSVYIEFQVRVNPGLTYGERIYNTATLNNGADFIFEIEAPWVSIGTALYLPLVSR